MKLSTALAQKVEQQFGIEAFPEDHPVTPKLVEVFGEHTFFLDANGLNIIEPDPAPENNGGVVVKLASWNDDRSQLTPHEPQVLPVAVDIVEDEGSEPAA